MKLRIVGMSQTNRTADGAVHSTLVLTETTTGPRDRPAPTRVFDGKVLDALVNPTEVQIDALFAKWGIKR